MIRFIADVIERTGIVLSALVFIQVPLFIQQYEQQLIGRISELKLQVDAMKTVAQGRSLDEYIGKFIANSDSDFSKHGEILKGIVQRYNSLGEAYNHLMNATVYEKPFIFLSHLHQDVALSTWKHFSFGLPLTFEGAAYAFLGVLFGMLFCKIIRLILNKSAKPELRAR